MSPLSISPVVPMSIFWRTLRASGRAGFGLLGRKSDRRVNEHVTEKTLTPSEMLKRPSLNIRSGIVHQDLVFPDCPVPGATTRAVLSSGPLTYLQTSRISEVEADRALRTHQRLAKAVESYFTRQQKVNATLDSKKQLPAIPGHGHGTIARTTVRRVVEGSGLIPPKAHNFPSHGFESLEIPPANVILFLSLSTEWDSRYVNLRDDSRLTSIQRNAEHEALQAADKAFGNKSARALSQRGR